MSASIAEFNYIVPSRERPRSFAYIPADGSPRSTVVTEAHRLPIQDLREEGTDYTLDRAGFAVVEHQSKVGDFRRDADPHTLLSGSRTTAE